MASRPTPDQNEFTADEEQAMRLGANGPVPDISGKTTGQNPPDQEIINNWSRNAIDNSAAGKWRRPLR